VAIRKLRSLYDLMDAAYVARLSAGTNRKCGHIPIAEKMGE
jgi:hypothetical protein